MNDYDKAKEMGLTDMDRWGKGIGHHPMSERLAKFLLTHDDKDYSNHFDWSIGGDGDNGETLMFQMDAFFEMMDSTEAPEIDRQRAMLARYRRLVSKLAVAPDKNQAWAIAKCWAPDDFWRAIGFDLENEEAQQKFLFK